MEINEPAEAYSKKKYTIEEYLEMENASIEKHEYYQGEIFAMSGNKSQHIIVAGNLYACLWNKLDGQPCQPYNSDTRVYIEKNSLFTYPDLSVFCGEPISLNNDDFNFMNPVIIVEVLSPTTRDYDRNNKLRLYRDFPGLMEYILVEPETVYIETYKINKDNLWELSEYKAIEEHLVLPTIQVSIPLKDIYKNTKILK